MKRRAEAVIIIAPRIDLAGHYLRLTHLRHMVQEAERLRATRRPRYVGRCPFAADKSPRKLLSN
jgi:hypothetical protein